MFIAVYGINNIGKSTQVKLLVDFLNSSGKKSEAIKYPVYDQEPTGPRINYLLRDAKAPKVSAEELQLWYTLNRFQAQPELQKKLADGITVVAEDYIGTGIAWGMTHGADKQWLVDMNKHLFPADMSILLDGDQFQSGRETQHLNEAHDELIAKCRQIHLELAKEYGWKVVNANGTIEEISKTIQEIV
jgi:thymidylate kinase